MMIFTHTLKEPGMWRGWLGNGQVLELHRARTGWDFGAGILIHSNDSDFGDRIFCLKFWRFSAYLPLGIVRRSYSVGDEPQWSIFGSKEFGLWFHVEQGSWRYDWPGTVFTVSYEKQVASGEWVSVFDNSVEPHKEQYAYRYILKSGTAQNRTATVSKRRHVLNRRWLHRILWPTWTKESIHVEFSDEVGERTGSWKGGTIGCGYDLRSGETLEQCLRRMEINRVFE